jgi:hypothetical protein
VYRCAVLFPVGEGRRVDLTHRALVVAPAALLTDRRGGPGPLPDLVLPDLVLLGPADADPVDGVGSLRILIGAPPAVPGPPVLVEVEPAALAALSAESPDPAVVVVDLGVDRAVTPEDAADRVAATGPAVALGHPVCVGLRSALGSTVAVVTAAMWAGARLLRVDRLEDVRDVRRAADVVEALLMERSPDLPAGPAR